MIEIKKHYWVFPLIVLVLLLIAPYFRWEYTASKTTEGVNGTVMKWKTDRWSDTRWLESYTRSGAKEEQIYYLYPRMQRDEATRIWKISVETMVAITALTWLTLLGLKLKTKKDTMKE